MSRPVVKEYFFQFIDVDTHNPIKQHSHRLNPIKRAQIQQEVDYLVARGLAVAYLVEALGASPCLLVPKPDCTSRFCTDLLSLMLTLFLSPGWSIVLIVLELQVC